MATLHLTIAGRRHELACRDGEEAHLQRLVDMVDVKAKNVGRQMGGMSEAREMLFAALLLADELNDARESLSKAREDAARIPAPAPAEPDPALAERIERLAERLERLGGSDDAIET